jgi:hypothetical protein
VDQSGLECSAGETLGLAFGVLGLAEASGLAAEAIGESAAVGFALGAAELTIVTLGGELLPLIGAGFLLYLMATGC